MAVIQREKDGSMMVISGDCFAALAMTVFGYAGCGFVIARPSGRGNLVFGPATRGIEIASLRSQ